MAYKEIKTRISLKTKSWADWQTEKTSVPLKGEVCVCLVPANTTATGIVKDPPNVLLKVGDGTTTWENLPWVTALAGDVPSWAKKTKPEYSDLQGVPTIGNGTITVKQKGQTRGTFSLNSTSNTTIELTDDNTDTNTQYQLVLADQEGESGSWTLKLQQKNIGDSTWADVVGQAWTIKDKDTTYTFEGAANNGVYFEVTPKGSTTAQKVYINGVGTAATKNIGDFDAAGAAATVQTDLTTHKNASNPHNITKDTVGLGQVQNFGRDTQVTINSANYITSGAVKAYVDNVVGAVKQFEYVVVEGDLPTAAAATMNKIYLKAHSHNTQDGYDEFITVQTDSTYKWEKIGNTDIDLAAYAKTADVVQKSQTIAGVNLQDNITKAELLTALNVQDGANNFVLEAASANAYGGIKIGFTEAGKKYPVELENGTNKAYVEVPWTDTNTNDNQTVGVNDTVFSNNALVKFKAGTNLTVSASTADNSITYNGLSDQQIVEKVKNAGEFVVKGGVAAADGGGLKVDNTDGKNPKIAIDDEVVFVFNCNYESGSVLPA